MLITVFSSLPMTHFLSIFCCQICYGSRENLKKRFNFAPTHRRLEKPTSIFILLFTVSLPCLRVMLRLEVSLLQPSYTEYQLARWRRREPRKRKEEVNVVPSIQPAKFSDRSPRSVGRRRSYVPSNLNFIPLFRGIEKGGGKSEGGFLFDFRERISL